ncbi:hypothetical protein WKI65_38585 [Streptomyces sp. MS1.AVA.3]|uniref:hypothetical protein n=1 Tax=Streptomyces decoyicus TaxID=249567 RepID=UPI0030C43989
MTRPLPTPATDAGARLPTAPGHTGEAIGPAGQLTLDQLREHVAAGRVDTVLLAVPDLQGRLKGKRYGAQHFLDRLATGSADMCAYVLATDVDMTPADGFALTSWATGYQDLMVTPAIETLRLTPWMPKMRPGPRRRRRPQRHPGGGGPAADAASPADPPGLATG